MKNLNDEFDEYRDCQRLVWNSSLRRRANGQESFDALSPALLQALVLDELEPGKSLGVTVATDNPEVLSPHESDDEIVWNRLEAGPLKGIVFLFAEILDFRDPEGMRDFDFVKAIVPENTPLPNGSIVAFRRSDVDIVDVSVRVVP